MSLVLVQACLNGSRSRAEHPGVPRSPEELAREAKAAVARGAGALHVHPRATNGAESFDADVCGRALLRIREACPNVPVGLASDAWIEPDVELRVELIARWMIIPDYVSVNFSELGAVELAKKLLARGIGVEAGLFSFADAEVLDKSGLAPSCTRILIEVEDDDPEEAAASARTIDGAVAHLAPEVPRLHHGTGPATWTVVERALALGRDIRIGLEDVLVLPDGAPARNNGELVAAAIALVERRGHSPRRGEMKPW